MRSYNEKVSIYHGMVAALSQNITANYIPLFAMAILGATNYQVGLISSLPPLMTLIMTIPAAVMLNKAVQQKRLVSIFTLMARVVFLGILFVAFMQNKQQAAWIFLILYAFMSIPNTVATIGWQTLIGSIVAEERRGKFFSERNRLLTLVGLITTLLIGIFMRDATENAVAYQILFALAFVFGLLEVYLLLKHEEGVKEVVKTKRHKAMNWAIFKDSRYVRFLTVALIFNFGWQMAWGLFNVYNVRYAEATIFWISIFSVANMVTQILSYSLWQKWADRFSNMRTFIWVAFGMSTAPFLIVLSTNLYYLTFASMISGFFVSGTVLILFNLLLEQSPEEYRTYSITTYNVLLALIAFIAPQFGIWLLETWDMHVAMYGSSIVRVLAACGFLYMFLKNKM